MNSIGIFVILCMNLSTMVLLIGLSVGDSERDTTNLSAIRAVGTQCNENYSGMVPRLKTYEEVYPDGKFN